MSPRTVIVDRCCSRHPGPLPASSVSHASLFPVSRHALTCPLLCLDVRMNVQGCAPPPVPGTACCDRRCIWRCLSSVANLDHWCRDTHVVLWPMSARRVLDCARGASHGIALAVPEGQARQHGHRADGNQREGGGREVQCEGTDGSRRDVRAGRRHRRLESGKRQPHPV